MDKPEPAIIVIFGVTGDLATLKIIPALYNLFLSGQLPEPTRIVGISRSELSTDDILKSLQTELSELGAPADESDLQRFSQLLSTFQLSPSDPDGYQSLKQRLEQLDEASAVCMQRYFYLSIPPQAYTEVIAQLGNNGLNTGCSHGHTSSRLLVEKPFGHDLASAEELIRHTAEHFSEDQLFRIDHFLAKETAQNILLFRQKNPLFAEIWNRRHIKRISITAAETIGIEGRANFYDQIGALRDVVQSHLMQLLAVTLMEVPDELSAEAVHANRQAVLNSLLPVTQEQAHKQAVRGQYETYSKEVNTADTGTETFAALTLFSQHPDWQDVPLRLTTGKMLKLKRTSITVDFGVQAINRLQFRIRPNEGITLSLQVKEPGLTNNMQSTTMDFDYQSDFKFRTPDAYQRVLIDAMRADHTLFATSDEVLASWRIIQPLIEIWQQNNDGLESYENGSDGPDVSALM